MEDDDEKDEVLALAHELAGLWLGSPAERAQVIPRLQEMTKFQACLVTTGIVSRLHDEPDGMLIPDFFRALLDADRRYGMF